MPDLSEQLSAILQNPEAQRNIRQILSSLGNSQSEEKQNPPMDFSSLFSQNPQNEEPLGGIDMNTLLKIQSIFSKMSCDNKSVNLIMALKPLLKEPKKADNAINILRLMSILPALGESGLFGGDFR